MADPHLVLVGLMGTGKSTVGRKLAARLGRPFLDSDDQIEADTGRTVREIWETDGEDTFRQLETEALRSALTAPDPSVIAAAGGVVLSSTNRQLLAGDRPEVSVVWLRARPELLAKRLADGHGTHRPLLDGDPLGTLRRMAVDRAPLYEEVADHIVDIDRGGSDAAAEHILELLGVTAP